MDSNPPFSEPLIGGPLAPVELVESWPLVKVPVDVASGLHFTCAGNVHEQYQGQSLWWATLPGHRIVGIAFQWQCAAINGGVAVIEDPMAVVTNMLLQSGEEYLSETGHAQVLMSLLARHYRAMPDASLVPTLSS